MLDQDWTLTEAGGRHLEVYDEAYAMYEGNGPERVLSLIDDAATKLSADNARALAAMASPATTGERGPTLERHGTLEAWLSTPDDERQLFVTGEDVLPGAAEALGLEGWARRELVFRDGGRLSDTYPYVGMRLPGVGVLGPFGSAAEEGLATVFGYAPPNRSAEVVGWTAQPVQGLGGAHVLGSVPAAAWGSAGALWVDVIARGDGLGLRFEPVDGPGQSTEGTTDP